MAYDCFIAERQKSSNRSAFVKSNRLVTMVETIVAIIPKALLNQSNLCSGVRR